jgi:cation:H+ antiporter
MILQYLMLLLGLVLLAFSGDWLVRGGSSLAKRFHVSPLVIGVTIISLGTSAPEMVVSLNAALSGYPDISIGNVVGSNIANIALVLGATALIISVPVSKKTIKLDWAVMMLATVLFFLFSLNGYLKTGEGIIFIILLIAYVIYSIRSSRTEMKNKIREIPPFPTALSFGIVLVTIGGLILGSNLLVNSARSIAIEWGVSERVISLSVIAFGTSVPELATSIMAAIRKELDISVGNLIGSNIFNIFGILGVTSLMKDIPVNEAILKFDWFWMVGICLLLLVFVLPGKHSRIRWWQGLMMLMAYFVYYFLIYTS